MSDMTETALWAAVGAAPDDQLPRLVLADWLDEREAEVECPACSGAKELRVCTSFMYSCHEMGLECDCGSFRDCHQCDGTGRVSNGYADLAAALRATADRVPLGNGGRSDAPPFAWYGNGISNGVHPESDVTESVFALLGGEDWDTGSFRWYATAELAIRDLCRAWAASQPVEVRS